MTINVIIADDHHLVRSGIRLELSRHPDLSVVGEAVNGDETLSLTRELRPDLLILDVYMPGLKAFEVLQTLRKEANPAKVLVLTAYSDTSTILGMLRAGADGYLLKDDDPYKLPEAIRALMEGKSWYSEPISAQLTNFAIKRERNEEKDDLLTEREQEVLRFLAEGFANKDIAEYLGTTERTVEFHVSNILNKLDVNSRTKAALWARERGFI